MKWQDTLDVSETFNLADEKAAMVDTAVLVSNYQYGDDEWAQLAEELTDAAAEGNLEWFDAVWNAIYDWGDFEKRLWIKTW